MLLGICRYVCGSIANFFVQMVIIVFVRRGNWRPMSCIERETESGASSRSFPLLSWNQYTKAAQSLTLAENQIRYLFNRRNIFLMVLYSATHIEWTDFFYYLYPGSSTTRQWRWERKCVIKEEREREIHFLNLFIACNFLAV